MPGVLAGGSWGEGRFLMGEVTLYKPSTSAVQVVLALGQAYLTDYS
jgi:hypothetical protein